MDNDTLRVSRMTAEDLTEAAMIESRSYTTPWSERSFREVMDLPFYLFLKASDGSRIAGYCGFQRSFETADIINVTVAEEYRGRGIGTLLLGRLMEEGRAAGVERFTLEVRVSNRPAIALYEKFGFRGSGLRRDFYELPREDALIMWTD